MLRGITKKRKHTHRRRTMRKKNRTMRRRHSSHLKHSRRNLHRRREGGGGGKEAFPWVLKFAKGVVKAGQKAQQDAEYERRQQEAKKKRDDLLKHPPRIFSAPHSSAFTIIPPASAASAASAAPAIPRLASTAQDISSGEFAGLSAIRSASSRPMVVPEGMVYSPTIQRIRNSTGRR